MQKEFNKLDDIKKRKFLIKNILKNDFFIKYHNEFSLFIEYIYSKRKQAKELKERDEKIYLDYCANILTNYKHNVLDCVLFTTSTDPVKSEFYLFALSNKLEIEKLFNNKLINSHDENGFTFSDLLSDVIYQLEPLLTNELYNLSLSYLLN